MNTGDYVLFYIRQNGVSQVDLANIINVTPSLLNEVIKGKRQLTAKLALDLEYWLKEFSAQKALYMQVDEQICKIRSLGYPPSPKTTES